MNNFDIAYAWVFLSEDPENLHAIVPDDCPRGCQGPCFAISGINSGAHPEAFKAIAALPQSQRDPLVRAFYAREYWSHWFEAIQNVEVSKRVMDFDVNSGTGEGVRVLQTCVGSPADGIIGPNTVAAVNQADQTKLVSDYKDARAAFLLGLAASRPSLAPLIGTLEQPGPLLVRAMR